MSDKTIFPPSSNESYKKDMLLLSFLLTSIISNLTGASFPPKKMQTVSKMYLIIGAGFLLDFNSTISPAFKLLTAV